jgi:sortase (surface protein transpeptidase)
VPALNRRRLAIDILIALLGVGGLVLVVVGSRPPVKPDYRSAEAASQPIPGPPAANGTRPGGARVPADTGDLHPPAWPATRPSTGASPPTSSPETSSPSTGHPAGPVPLRPSQPVRLVIPAIGVDTPLLALGLNADGTIAVPPLRRDAPAGWYRNLATPGEIGPAVIVGHVDTARDGPAVFYRLPDLRTGDQIAAHRADGTIAVFTVDLVAQYPKSAFPTDAVYGAVDRPALRLVTCGGTFDPIHRRYRGNVVVYASLTATTSN